MLNLSINGRIRSFKYPAFSTIFLVRILFHALKPPQQSQVTYLQRISVTHEIQGGSSDESDLIEDLKVNRDLHLLCAAEKIAFILLVALFGRLIDRRTTRTLLENLLDFRSSYRRFGKVALILVFFRLSNLFYRLLVNNSMRVMKSLIDSSQIITNPTQLLSSQYEFCFFRDDDLYRLMKRMPERSIFRQLYDRRKPEDHCTIDLGKLNERIDFTNRAFFINPRFVRSILSIYGKEKEQVGYSIQLGVLAATPLRPHLSLRPTLIF